MSNVINCMDCKFCEIDRSDDTAECQKGRTLKVSTTDYDCDSDGKPFRGTITTINNIYPEGDDCEEGEE
jgi:hypothetical protein